MQAYEGVVIARSGAGLNENFTVRKISYGEGVERVFPVYSPLVEAVEIVRRGKVRRAKLYYLRDRRGKSARISENTGVRARKLNDAEREAMLAEKARLEAEKIAAAEALAAEKAAQDAAEAKAADEAKAAAEAKASEAAFLLRGTSCRQNVNSVFRTVADCNRLQANCRPLQSADIAAKGLR